MSAKDERPESGPDAPRAPRVVCGGCDFAWHSAIMAEGLRLIGSCPRCGGELRFGDEATAEPDEARPERFAAPHLALGLPRPPRRAG